MLLGHRLYVAFIVVLVLSSMFIVVAGIKFNVHSGAGIKFSGAAIKFSTIPAWSKLMFLNCMHIRMTRAMQILYSGVPILHFSYKVVINKT